MDLNTKDNSAENLEMERVFINMLMKTFVMEIGGIIKLKGLLTIAFQMVIGMNNDYVQYQQKLLS